MISNEKWRFKFISNVFNVEVFLISFSGENTYNIETIINNKETITISKKFLDFAKKNRYKDYVLPFFYKEKGNTYFEEYYYLDYSTYIMFKFNTKNTPNFKEFNEFKNTLILESLNSNPCKNLFESDFSSEDGIVILDENANELYASSNAKLICTKATNVIDFYNRGIWKEFLSKSKFISPKFFTKTLKNENYIAKLDFYPIFRENKLKYFVIVVRDLSKKLLLEVEKQKQLNTMKEINHMIKNNLQIIKSILNIKSRRLSDRELIDDISIKLECLAKVHEQLIKLSEEVSLKTLLENLFKVITNSGKEKLYVYGDLIGEYQKILLLILALIELMQNSVKHAFLTEEQSKIFISIVKSFEKIRITYQDFGEFKAEEPASKGHGSDLVKALLIDGLNASFTRLSTKKGSLFEIILENF
ncbi:signal transduction histidine kinase [Thermodesulfobium narugense DSM 14796]|uniref:histidine kinase n=1 Tax=Thermodesulfobium narugense DSM 14796 TaxID=747365 RepID=M1E8N7_9BACT|nr:histidine kinase dimerization/phosphoacceptor domain -containing protein [Thermodesulfobium narugense]AEE14584.1 signal transduction histidine kinase [Thermodesulfobium narugense DSM 14796]